MPPLHRPLAWVVLLAWGTPLWGAKNAPLKPAADLNRIINESYSFLKEREPDMTETEYALYEKVIPMIAAQPEFALRLLEGMVAEADSSAAFEFVLGNVYFEQKRYPDAEARFKLAVEKYATFVRAWDSLGVLYFTTERYPEAVPCFTKAIILGRAEPRLFGLLAYCLLRSDNPLAAEAAYLQAYALDPNNGDWIEGLLSSYLHSQQFARAETLLRQLVRLKPQESRFWLLLANVILAQGRKLDTIAQLETASSLQVIEPDGLMLLGDLYAEQKFFAEAVRTYEALTAATASMGIERMLRYASALTAENKLAQAAQVLETITPLAAGEQRAALLQARADIHQARQEWPQAAELLLQVIEQVPMNGKALLDLGTAQEALGREALAILYFESAAQLPDFAYSAHLKLANLHVKLQHFDEAVAAIDQALALQTSAPLLEFQARVRAMAPKKK